MLEITKVIQHYEGEIERQTGGQFNLMKILGVGHLEVKTHSPILGDLLNPSGSHGQGAIFLECFLKLLEIKGFDSSSATLRLEYHTGAKTENSGGRIDIFLHDGAGKKIIIENKIYAQEMDKQMLRYSNAFPDANLIYLTLNGDEPKTAGDNQSNNLLCIAYKLHILDWLERCRREAVDVPIVREAIVQYINLIKQLTNQNTSDRMSQKISESALSDATSLRAYFALVQAQSEIQEQIVNGLLKRIQLLSNDLGLDFHPPQDALSWKYSGFEFTCAGWLEFKFRLRFEMGMGDFRGFAFGFVDEGLLSDASRSRLREGFELMFSRSSQTKTWPAWKIWEPYYNWTPEVFDSIQFGGFMEDFKQLLTQINEVANNFIEAERSQGLA